MLQNFALKKNGLIIVVAKLQTGFDEKKLHTLFLDKEIRGINAIQTISRVNRKTKNKHECKIVDFSYNNVNVQNIKDAFEYFSDVVVSDFDPFSDKKVLELLLTELKKSETFTRFFPDFTAIWRTHPPAPSLRKRGGEKPPFSFQEKGLGDEFESRLNAYIDANPESAADSKAKAAQYFTILDRIQYVIELDAKYGEPVFLAFWRVFNTLYNLLHRSEDLSDPIAVYFDKQIGIVEVVAEEPSHKEKRPTKVAEGGVPYGGKQLDILDVIAARNAEEAKTGALIQEFKAKLDDFYRYVRESDDGKRLIVKITSHVAEAEIYEDFGKIYRRYRALNRKSVGEYFFKETDDLVEMLCDNFERQVRNGSD